MEESSEAHMETDVSSTTEDVPEAQEVTGSNGNVEMVVIVEKVTEEESSSSEVGGEQLSAGDSEVATSSNTPMPQVSPQKPTSQSPQTSPLKSSTETKPSKSPKKVSDPQNTSLSDEHSYNKNAQDDNLGSPLLTSQSEQTVDSSIKIDVQKSPQKNISSPKKVSPIKIIDALKSPKSPIIVVSKPSPGKDQSQEGKNSIKETETVTEKPALNGIEKANVNENETCKTATVPIEIVIEKEASNDSQTELHQDASEKEHNKSISRELKSLIKSAKESKIISECTQLTTKTRKSRAPLDVSNSSLNVSVEAEKIKDIRRSSVNSQKSNCSEKSEKVPVKRSMRSQNPEFVNKVKQFLNSVTSKVQKESDEGTDEELDDKSKEIKGNKDIKDSKSEYTPSLPKKKKVGGSTPENCKLRSDPYCWRCHWEVEQAANEKSHPPMICTVCPRSFHYKCLSGAERSKISAEKSWVCPECMGVLHAESSETRSPAMKKISLGVLCELLKHALERMMDLNGVEPFMQPVERNLFPDYEKYVVHPMDLTQMRDNITAGLYGSTEAFLADAQWILHNSIIFNTLQSKLTGAARQLVRSCRAELGEIEACPECYAAAHARNPTWFTDVCSTPHMLLWAKLKGFPYWPAKGMSVNNAGLVDVRFFGAHDRAWVPAKDCFLYSEKDPNNFRTKRQDIIDSMQEAEEHIRNISRKYGKFVYPPFKTQFDPAKLNEQLKMMIPSFEGEVRAPVKDKHSTSPSMVKDKSRSNSKSSKSSFHDGDMSEGEEPSKIESRKMADGADIARLDEDEKDKTMEVDGSQLKEEENEKEKASRKRRRSEMEEAATLTIISSSTKEKKKKKETESDDNVEEMKAETESQASTTSSKDEDKQPKATEPTEKENPSPKSKDSDSVASSSESEKVKELPKLTPIKLVISTKSNKIIGKSPISKGNTSTPKVLPIRIKQTKLDKTITISKISKDKDHKEEKNKSHRRRNSKNKSLNNSNVTNSEKTDKTTEKKVEKTAETVASKEKKDSTAVKSKEDANKSTTEKPGTPKPSVDSPKAVKDRIQFDEDDTSLAVIAREVKGNVTSNNVSGMPTISSVRSLSTQNTTAAKNNAAKTIEVTIEPNNDSLLIPTSTGNVRKEAQKPKEVEPSLVGRVGVRAFARMASPEPQRSKDVEVEIKAEPIDFEDQDRQSEKLDMMKAFKLRPVHPPQNNLREVRINKVVMTPLNARKTAAKPAEVKPRARKTFPQPRKPDEGRSELNSKNSMVYIPIQPPATPGPRGPRPVLPPAGPAPAGLPMLGARPPPPIITSTVTQNSIVNTVTAPLVPSSMSQLSSCPAAASPAPCGSLPLVPTIGQVPTTVHTVPLITSVNGQWTFSLQPIMSVGGLDDTPSPPLLNGLPERTNGPQPLVAGPQPLVAGPGPVVTPAVVTPGAVVLPALPAASTAPAAPAVSTPQPALSAAPVVTPNRTPVESNANPGEPPRLQQRPKLMNPLDSHTPMGNLPTPSTAGPVTAKLNQNAVKLTDFFRTLLEDSLEKLDEPSCQMTMLKLQLEQSNWRHQQELEEMKHNHDLVLAEMRSSFEKEKARLTSELRRAAQAELDAAVKAAKAKQWCANCSQEAQFYCCWNTSYCDYPCQRAHWNSHFALCAQQREPDAPPAPLAPPAPQTDNMPKSTTAPSTTPTLTAGGKLAPQKQSSIIMSMVEDKSGNQTLRCLGTYKPAAPAPTNQISPIIINKQIINNEDTTGKKVVTSGGYLIVGANASGSAVTPPRRTHSIQYYT